MVARLLLVVALAGLTGCAAGGTQAPRAVAPPQSPARSSASAPSVVRATASVSPSAAPATPTRRAHPLAHRAALFTWRSARVTGTELGKSWHAGCPVAPSRLRAVTVTTWGFDHAAHPGTLVVAASAVDATVRAFQRIYAARFPIRRMVPISAYGGDDNRSMAADNTSAFNCRYAVSDGPKSWSMHAYGLAVDINTLENPYTLNGRVYPPAGRPYTDRSRVRPGMIVAGSVPVQAFSAVGWGWGGRWSSSPDYQHFSANGK